MTDFVLEQYKNPLQDDQKAYENIIKYAEFIRKPLTLGMFVPCDADGDVFIKPNELEYQLANEEHMASKWVVNAYQEAKEKVLFKGFEWDFNDKSVNMAMKSGIWIFGVEDIENTNVESFGGIENEIELTESAIKQIGL